MKTMKAKDLKNALLQEAVQGKLVPQIAAEGNAADLLNAIRKEKAELIKAGKLKKEKPLPPITDDEKPFDIPENWCWCKLGEVCVFENGDRSSNYPVELDYVNDGIPFFGAADMRFNELVISKDLRFISEEKFSSLRSGKLKDKDFVMLLRGAVGKWAQFSATPKYKTGFINAQMVIIRVNSLIIEYIRSILNSPVFLSFVSKKTTGTAVAQMSAADLSNLIIPLPPLAEQKRIVSAIERFMPLIEEYGKKEEVLSELNAAIGEQAKKALLQEAVQGKLVPQIAAEGNAADLLKQIQAEKAQLIKAGKLKKEKPLPPITDDEKPFDIPESWCWCRLGEIYSTLSGLSYKKETLVIKSNKMIRVLRGGNILDTTYVIKDDDVMISSEFVKPELILKKNYLITPAVTSLEHIGKIGRIEKDYTDTVVGGFVLMLIPNYDNDFLSQYSLYAMSTHWFRCLCKEITHKSGQAFYNLSREKLLQLPIPLPPLAEQKRIVEALEKMLPLCEMLGK